MIKGLMAPMMPCDDEEYAIVTAEENKTNTKMVMSSWMLGPEKDPSDEPDSNTDYWKTIAVAWQMDEKEARRQRCANCEYFDNTPEMMLAMEDIPRNEFDTGGGGRGYCHKFEFICHNLRTCQAWERKEYEKED